MNDTSKQLILAQAQANFSDSGELIFLDDVPATRTEWLWYPYIPCGKVTIIMGDPGEGKSTFALNLAAAVTRGEQFPTGEPCGKPGIVIYQNAEDGLSDTVRPRLDQAGADPRQVVTIAETNEPVTATHRNIQQLIYMTRAKLLILDPLQAYLGAEVDMHRANEVRPVMARLSALAEETGCAIVLIGHMNKRSDVKSIYRGIGSIDLTAAARSVLLVGRDPSEPGRRVIAQGKNSLAPEGENVAFTINDGVFHFEGVCDVPTERLLSQRERRVTPRDKAAECLTRWLTEHGEISVREIYDMACGEDIAKPTLMRARTKLGIVARRRDNQWYWSLPKQA